MSYIEFQVGEKFPLPIKAQGDGGIFQYDVNGAMFILKLSRVDLIAIEAFRTGKIELGLFSEKEITFFLYKLDGIASGWGDCPYSARCLPANQQPDWTKPQENILNLYLVDSRLDILLAMRSVTLSDEFYDALTRLTKTQCAPSVQIGSHLADVQTVWQNYTSDAMRENAIAVQKVDLALSPSAKLQ